MDKTECRAVIKFFVKEGLTPNEIMALEHLWNKCISLKGDYVKK
jgi:hypothetical protein